MTVTHCPDLSVDPAILLVGDAHGKFMQQGTETYDLAISALNGLNELVLAPVEFNVSFDYANDQPVFNRPERPDMDTGALDFRDPGITIGPAPAFEANPLVIDAAPEFNEAPPSLVFGPRPTTPDVRVPREPAQAVPLDIPAVPVYALPLVPTMVELNLPIVPDIVLPLFDAERPVFVDPPFEENWAFEPEPYTRNLVDQLTTTLSAMIVGSEAIPQIIARAIFERSRSRIGVETDRQVEQAFAEFGSRGFDEPPGQLKGRVTALRQTGLNATAEAARDLAIKELEECLASQRQAIAQGAALEGVLVQLHFEEQRTLLQAATFQRESALAALNFRVTVFNTKMQGYQVDAAVLRDRIAAELSRIELFRAQLEGELAKGQLNEQRTRQYEAELRGVQTLAAFYREQVETVKVKADINRLDIERYKAEWDGYGERWRAHAAEWAGYSAGVEGEGKRADLYRTLVDANSKRVDAWAQTGNLKIEAERLRLAQHGVDIETWRGGIQQLEALLGTERTRLLAAGQGLDARARIYSADASVEQTVNAAADRSFQLGLERERSDTEVQLEKARIKIKQMEFLLSQAAEIQKAKAQIAGQLAASTMSAVSYSASLSSGRTKGTSCTSNFSFQGEIADA